MSLLKICYDSNETRFIKQIDINITKTRNKIILTFKNVTMKAKMVHMLSYALICLELQLLPQVSSNAFLK